MSSCVKKHTASEKMHDPQTPLGTFKTSWPCLLIQLCVDATVWWLCCVLLYQHAEWNHLQILHLTVPGFGFTCESNVHLECSFLYCTSTSALPTEGSVMMAATSYHFYRISRWYKFCPAISRMLNLCRNGWRYCQSFFTIWYSNHKFSSTTWLRNCKRNWPVTQVDLTAIFGLKHLTIIVLSQARMTSPHTTIPDIMIPGAQRYQYWVPIPIQEMTS